MAKTGLTLAYIAGVAMPARRLVKQGPADKFVVMAIDGGVPIIGVSEQIAVAAMAPVDVIHSEVAVVEAGAAIALSSPITADASGRAITAAPAAGVNMWIVGITLEAATAAGDFIRVLVKPERIQG
jgi:hypothetical protein